MTRLLNVVDTADLTPVHEAVLRIAHAAADAVRADADREIDELRRSAAAEVTALLDGARAQGAQDTAVLIAAEHSRALREARSIELRARRAGYEALVSAARATARTLLAEDPKVVAAMTDLARTELGPQATLTRTPDGGLTAELDGRRMGLPLAALVESAVADLLSSREFG